MMRSQTCSPSQRRTAHIRPTFSIAWHSFQETAQEKAARLAKAFCTSASSSMYNSSVRIIKSFERWTIDRKQQLKRPLYILCYVIDGSKFVILTCYSGKIRKSERATCLIGLSCKLLQILDFHFTAHNTVTQCYTMLHNVTHDGRCYSV